MYFQIIKLQPRYSNFFSIFQMNHRRVLEVIEQDIIGSSDKRRRPFGIDFVHNIAQSKFYLYDRAHVTGYTDTEHLKPVLEDLLTDVKMETWPIPVKYLIENTSGTVIIKVYKWDFNITIANFSCDRIIKVSYVYPVRVKHEFHVRILN